MLQPLTRQPYPCVSHVVSTKVELLQALVVAQGCSLNPAVGTGDLGHPQSAGTANQEYNRCCHCWDDRCTGRCTHLVRPLPKSNGYRSQLYPQNVQPLASDGLVIETAPVPRPAQGCPHTLGSVYWAQRWVETHTSWEISMSGSSLKCCCTSICREGNKQEEWELCVQSQGFSSSLGSQSHTERAHMTLVIQWAYTGFFGRTCWESKTGSLHEREVERSPRLQKS